MKKHFLKSLLTGFMVMVSIHICIAQSMFSDSTAINHTIDLFNKAIGEQSQIYNGPEYQLQDRNLRGNVYFKDISTWQPGTVNYDGVVYRDIPMMYDIYSDLVVVMLYNKFSLYTLLPERVSSFSVSGHNFVRIVADDSEKSGVNTGYYDVLYAGKISVLGRSTKTIQTTSGGIQKIENYVIPKTEYFLKRGNNYYSFKSKGSLLNLLKDKKPQLQQYIKSTSLSYQDAPELAMVKIAAYYDQISN